MTTLRPTTGGPGGGAGGDPPPRWALNPYRTAELLLGKPLAARDRSVGEALEDVFRTKLELLFAPEPQTPTLLDLLRDPRIAGSAFPSVEAALAALREIGGASIESFADAQLARLAPWLLPVDAGLHAPPGVARPAQPDRRAVYGNRYVDALSFRDPRQGATADCYLIAAMIAIAWTWPQRWQTRIASTRPQDDSERWFSWRFAGESSTSRVIELDADIWVDTDGQPVYASSLDRDEQWPALVEKAYAMWRNGVASRRDPSPVSYVRIGEDLRQWPEVAGVALLAGGRGHRASRILGAEMLSESIDEQLDGNSTRAALIASTWAPEKLAEFEAHPAQRVREDAEEVRELFRTAGVVLQQNHAYAVLGTHRSGGRQYVVLRDPHARDPARRHCAVGIWRPGSTRHGVSEVELESDGVFALERDLFDKMFLWLCWIEFDD